MSRRFGWSLKLAAVLAVIALGTLVGTAGATVPPRDCGDLTVAAKRYNVKSDQLRCAPARRHAVRYLRTHRGPRGWRCRDYERSRMTFRCSRGVAVFFAIRR